MTDLRDLLKRIRRWDALDIPDTDGAFWKREIDAALEQPARPLCKGIPRRGCNYLAPCDTVCNKCGEIHHHHQMVAQFQAAQQPEQEPVYWEYKHVDDGLERWNRVVPRTGQTLETAAAEIHGYRRGLKRPYEVRALYTHPTPPRREWRGLTDTERAEVQYESLKRGLSPLEFMELHEAALKEKNHE